jgi:hypothetical protein
MQYFKPAGDFFVGDCMPFFHEGRFHLYYLVDENHHQGKNGLGGHQWAHASSSDLVQWQHHPLALGIDEPWECSICTGSVFYHEGSFYAFYATRRADRSEHLSLAISQDGVAFEKTQPNPFYSPPPGYAHHFRDPVVFRDPETGRFQMLVTAMLKDYPVDRRGGCLLHLTSADLRQWTPEGPFLTPGYLDPPECPDYFSWNGWYYLIFSNYGVARYRMSRQPFGPWLKPKVDAFDAPIARVMKTAAFKDGRRLGVAYLASRQGRQDEGRLQYAGNAVFRELIQQPDGSLGCRFPPEMVPAGGEPLALPISPLTTGVVPNGRGAALAAPEGFAAAVIEGVPPDARLAVEIKPQPDTALFGLGLRGQGSYERGYALQFLPYEGRVELGNQAISPVEGLAQPFKVEVIMKDDIIDVCIGERRCLINRCPERRGERLFLFCQNGSVRFDNLEVRPLI